MLIFRLCVHLVEQTRAIIKGSEEDLNTEIHDVFSIPVVKFPEVISLNVGGTYFTTRLSTLRRFEDTMLAAMFSGRHYIPRDADGRYFIDRDGTYFGWVVALCETWEWNSKYNNISTIDSLVIQKKTTSLLSEPFNMIVVFLWSDGSKIFSRVWQKHLGEEGYVYVESVCIWKQIFSLEKISHCSVKAVLNLLMATHYILTGICESGILWHKLVSLPSVSAVNIFAYLFLCCCTFLTCYFGWHLYVAINI